MPILKNILAILEYLEYLACTAQPSVSQVVDYGPLMGCEASTVWWAAKSAGKNG